jgi:hypothetical protein
MAAMVEEYVLPPVPTCDHVLDQARGEQTRPMSWQANGHVAKDRKERPDPEWSGSRLIC